MISSRIPSLAIALIAHIDLKEIEMRKVALAVSLAGFCAVSSYAADTGRSYVVPPAPKSGTAPTAPISSGVMVGETFYASGHLGLDPTGQPPADAEAEARMVMDALKHTLEQAGLKTDDLVSVTIFCTDLDLYDKFNGVYRTYFHGQYPSRAFIGVNKLVRGAHFEVSGIAVKPPGASKL
jgi:2-iminobutanoate/2-iminopropanoate deaminase